MVNRNLPIGSETYLQPSVLLVVGRFLMLRMHQTYSYIYMDLSVRRRPCWIDGLVTGTSRGYI